MILVYVNSDSHVKIFTERGGVGRFIIIIIIGSVNAFAIAFVRLELTCGPLHGVVGYLDTYGFKYGL